MKDNPALTDALYALNARTQQAARLATQMQELSAEEQRIVERAEHLMAEGKAGRFVSRAEVKRMKVRMTEIQGRKQILANEAERLEAKLEAGTQHLDKMVGSVLAKRAERQAAARKAGF
ncbi:hypothetical protein EBE87_25870 [Pseudoroseomonas wenyumeiae]|uniref:Uncharacterized protein n=1 Tax=Teichococcus wenyumeiae TaxID=2478470 RepID=A0A3A9JRJ5_9PROT|nr:hypothetical protein [Pseudoroseomonas wenyumeiae]RKK03298.1 hypothetical protein D6Z83_15170 [Pseudoroseomonas wenyumeiae]RMI15407.1 hypothetical protein EBE87_25870 [Pseudoroseomonas wenyumeiae]